MRRQRMNGPRMANNFIPFSLMQQPCRFDFNMQFQIRPNRPQFGRQMLRTPLMNSPPFPRHGYPRPMLPRPQRFNNSPQRGKRQMNSEPDHANESKRQKLEETPIDQDKLTNDQEFIVPCCEGTEKITVSIWEYFLKTRMTDSDLEKKLMLQQILHSVILEAFPVSRLFIVGSSMTGFATKTSDADMCLMISDNDHLNQKREAVLILAALAKSLRPCSFVRHSQVIKAKVPILKFQDQKSGFECDLNINNSIGIRNTHLLRYYAHMDWRVRPLMLFIKRWARFHDINDASKQTISSYSLSLMLIHYLQAAVRPAVLPCLQAMKPKLFNSNQDVRNLSLKLEKIDFKSSNKSTLGELFLGFLDYYSNTFSFERDVISVRKGTRISKDDVDYTISDWKFLCIEEPFECSNTARSVYDYYVFMRILRVFSSSFRLLNIHRNADCILSCPL